MSHSERHKNYNKSLGYGFGVLYCLITALSAIYIGRINHTVNPVLSQLIVFLISALWFTLCNAKSVKNLKAMYQSAGRVPKHWFMINLSTLMIWGFSFYALTFISPVLYLGLLMALMPLFTYVLLSRWYGLESWTLKNSLFAFVVLLLSVWMIGASMEQRGYSLGFLTGCVFTIVASIGAAWYLVEARLMQQKTGLKSTQMLALRFLLLLLVYLIYLGLVHPRDFAWDAMIQLPWSDLLWLALLTSVLPLYCMQVTLSRIGSLKFSFLMPLSPVLAYGILMVFSNYRNTGVLLGLLVLAGVLMSRSLVFKNKK